ncbi:MAG: TonB-dependent receptor [Bacteroidales bacterium]|nr:TonB-dependent receptor [Bacteroidales bacterium]
MVFALVGGFQVIFGQKVTLNERHVPLEQVLSKITDQTGYNFNYSQPGINPDKIVSLEVKDAELTKALDKLFAGEPIDYAIRDKKIFLTPKPQTPQKEESTMVVTGRVLDEEREPLIGASVILKGHKTGVSTDLDGNYTLPGVPKNGKIIVSYVGYDPKEITANSDHIDIRMSENSKLLDEVVIVGYGVQKKSDITGSVSSVKASELQSMPSASAMEALQGRVAGVVVQNASGDPAGNTFIRIRGSNSLTYGNDPLVIVDGVQDASIGSLNPNQIESMEVLKDAAALSIYGARGANGVIIVTTKAGKSERAQVQYNGYVSFDRVSKTLESLSAYDYATLMNEAQIENGLNPLFTSSEIAQLGQGTNWQDEIFRHAFSQVHNLSISSSKKGVSYFIAGGVTDKQGVIINSDFKEYTMRANLHAEAMKGLTISLNSFAFYSKSHKGDTEGALVSALQWSPTKTVYDADGLYVQPGGGIGPVSEYNPVGLAREIVSDQNKSVFNIALNLEYKFTDWLRFSTLLAYKSQSVMSGWFDNQVYNNGAEEDIAGSKTQSLYWSLQNTNMLTFDKDFSGHHVQATAVYELWKDKYDSTQAAAKGIPVGMGYQGVHFGTVLQKPWCEYSSSSMMSFMGRLNYAYKNRYLASASIRYDGASQLADGNKWDHFTAFSAGWNIASEEFMNPYRRVINELKLRGSYGTVGNSAVPAYSSQMKFTPGTDANGDPTLTISQLANNNLKWERTKEINVGIDTRFFNSRITFTAEYYYKKTTDLLMWRAVPTALGVESVLTNVGSVQNKGWEFALGGIPVDTRDFTWSINYSMDINRNKILELDGISDTLINSGTVDMPGLVGSYVQMVGQPMGTFLGYTYAGVWQQDEVSMAALYGAVPGDAKYVDLNNDGVIDSNDIGIIGNAQPKFTYGINNTIRFKCLDLNVFFQGVYGNDVYNQNRVKRESYTGGSTFPTSPEIANHWTSTNPSNIPAFSSIEYVNSSRWVEDGSYLRLKSLTLGFTFPEKILKKIKFNKIRVYGSATNLFTITNYKGYDPEASMGSDAYGAGIDRGIYPSNKSWVVGLDVIF